MVFAKFRVALNREILIQGRLYVGEEHVCFYANIFGWITSVVIAIRDIVAIERRYTAIIFPNAIQISTLHHRYFFASFIYREEAFKQLHVAWKKMMNQHVKITFLCKISFSSLYRHLVPVEMALDL